MIVRLAVVNGGSVRKIEQGLDSTDISWMLAAERVGLIPDPWQQTAFICAAVMNANTKRKDGRSWTADDFYPFKRRAKRMKGAEIAKMFDSMTEHIDKKKRRGGIRKLDITKTETTSED